MVCLYLFNYPLIYFRRPIFCKYFCGVLTLLKWKYQNTSYDLI